MSVVTRFAPSPTGFLHIGGARTALFNWLFARRYGGRYLLRIEDTDRRRSTDAAVAAILDGLGWLGLESDEPPVYQFGRRERHAEVARAMAEAGMAYPCYATPEELDGMRRDAAVRGERFQYNGLWRDRDPAEAPVGVAPAIRLRAPRGGETVIRDLVQGEVRVPNDTLDDMVLLRADGTPTYMLSVVVDDHDMGVTHVIRGDDHLNNAFRQAQVFAAMGWPLPEFAHIPLIHGSDGAKLSKRHGALGVDAYRDMGLLPEAVRNYLLRLGLEPWRQGDRSDGGGRRAVRIGGRGPLARPVRPGEVGERQCPLFEGGGGGSGAGAAGTVPCAAAGRGCAAAVGRRTARPSSGEPGPWSGLRRRPHSLWRRVRIPIEPKAGRILDGGARDILARYADMLREQPWEEPLLEAATRDFAEREGIGLGRVAQPVRAALTGRTASPGLFEVMVVLGREEALSRLADVLGAGAGPAP